MSEPQPSPAAARLPYAGAMMVGIVLLVAALVRGMAVWNAAAIVFGCYWFGCWAVALGFASKAGLLRMYRGPLPLRALFTWFPVAAVWAYYAPPWSGLSAAMVAAVLVTAVVNGVSEELCWRAAFVGTFPQSLRLGFFLPTVLYTAWHFAVVWVGLESTGGWPAVVGGAAVLGSLWGLAAFRSGDARGVTLAHILLNVATFASLARLNA